jgi:ubiquinone/menaquinone biosynthesis C-methylase UbiE
MPDEQQYILGTDAIELDRLRNQHVAWIERAYALLAQSGLRAGHTLLDLGCGPGFTTVELARLVGPTGRVIALDSSARFIEFLRAERERLALPQIEPRLGTAEQLDLPAASLDGAYARWLFCWLADPGTVMRAVADALRPGGVLVLQEYLDWGAKKLVPRSAAHDRVVAACMQSWAAGGATIDIGEHVPTLAARCGLVLEHFRPIARLGRVGSLEWRWLTEFYESYLPRLVERGLLQPRELEAWRRDWDARAAEGSSFCYTPTMVDAILRKP